MQSKRTSKMCKYFFAKENYFYNKSFCITLHTSNKHWVLLEGFSIENARTCDAHVEITSRESQPGFPLLHACQRVGLIFYRCHIGWKRLLPQRRGSDVSEEGGWREWERWSNPYLRACVFSKISPLSLTRTYTHSHTHTLDLSFISFSILSLGIAMHVIEAHTRTCVCEVYSRLYVLFSNPLTVQWWWSLPCRSGVHRL